MLQSGLRNSVLLYAQGTPRLLHRREELRQVQGLDNTAQQCALSEASHVTIIEDYTGRPLSPS